MSSDPEDPDLPHSITLRPCVLEDADTLALIGAATLLEAFAGRLPGNALLAHCRNLHQSAVYQAALALPTTQAWLAEVEPNAAPIGYSMVTAPAFAPVLLQPDDLELRRCYLFSRFHGSGTGQHLMEVAIAWARIRRAGRLLLGVHPENHRALAFYRRNGFVQIGSRTFNLGPATFEDPVLALTL